MLPTLTVSMPARNVAAFVGDAIRSVLAQTGVDLELIVVDDASTDATAAVVERLADPRIRLLRNATRQGIGACHNRILRESRAPFIAHVDADDFILPDALQQMTEALQRHPRAGLAHCHYFDVDAAGRTTREAFHRRWSRFRRDRPPGFDHRAALRHKSSVANHLRTYRRSVLEELGGFDESLLFGVDYDMALRIAERYEIVLVPEFLYVRRVHATNTTESLRFKGLRFWVQNYRVRRRALRTGRVTFLDGAHLDLPRFLAERWRSTAHSWQARWRSRRRRCGVIVRWRIAAPLAADAYRWLTRSGVRDRATTLPPLRCPPPAGARRVAYYLRMFPALSETFIQREIAALREAGVSVAVVAERARDVDHLDAAARALMETTRYLGPASRQRLRHFVWRRPATLARIGVALAFWPQGQRKSVQADWRSLRQVLRAAATLRDLGVTHVHAPWADGAALTAMLAARLLGVPFSVQARAYEIHWAAANRGLRERLAPARFVVTNSLHNAALLRGLFGNGAAPPIEVIYNGLDLTAFAPRLTRPTSDRTFRLLCVGRLTEQKGIDHLLHACKLLKERGVAVACEIVGPRSGRHASYAIALRRLHRDLGLQNEVRFVGALPFDQVRTKYAEADAVVLPAVIASDGLRDVTPNVLLEAMAMGLPVVSTTITAIPEIVDDGVSGLLVPPGDPAALAEAIGRLVADPDLRARLGANARRRIEERFDIRKNIRSYVALFASA